MNESVHILNDAKQVARRHDSSCYWMLDCFLTPSIVLLNTAIAKPRCLGKPSHPSLISRQVKSATLSLKLHQYGVILVPTFCDNELSTIKYPLPRQDRSCWQSILGCIKWVERIKQQRSPLLSVPSGQHANENAHILNAARVIKWQCAMIHHVTVLDVWLLFNRFICFVGHHCQVC